MTPLSDNLQRQAPLKIGRAPRGVGVEFQGWPRYSLPRQRAKSYRLILHDSLFPSEWWLRLYYGVGTARPLFWHRWLWHPLHLLDFGRQLMLERLGWVKEVVPGK
jgi:hypothetical protein